MSGPGRFEDVVYTLLCRDEVELVSHLNGIQQSFEAKGWTLATEPPTA